MTTTVRTTITIPRRMVAPGRSVTMPIRICNGDTVTRTVRYQLATPVPGIAMSPRIFEVSPGEVSGSLVLDVTSTVGLGAVPVRVLAIAGGERELLAPFVLLVRDRRASASDVLARVKRSVTSRGSARSAG